MKLKKSMRWYFGLAGVLGLASLAVADDAPKEQVTIVPAISAPSDKRNLTFFDSGIVHEMLVKPGDMVKVGQVLASEDAEQEELQLKAMKMEAESTGEIEGYEKDRDAKKIIRDNMKNAFDKNAANQSELDEAQLAFDEAEIKIKLAQEKRQEDLTLVAKQEKKIEKMKLISPVDGIVQKISVQVGEAAEPNKLEGAMTVVNNSPLWVEMHVSSALAAKLKMNDALQVSYANEPDKWISGSIIYFDPVVDAASDTQTIRLQLANTEGKPSGLQVNVKLPFTAGNGRSDGVGPVSRESNGE